MTSFDETIWTNAIRRFDYDRFTQQQQHLIEGLRADTEARRGDPTGTLERLTEMTSRQLEVGRVGLWVFDDDRSKIVCMDLFVQVQERHARGVTVLRFDLPGYFRALERGVEITADDAFNHPATSELAIGYLTAYGIGAMLDVPIFFDDDMIGVLCAEHVGTPRTWQVWERELAAALADAAGHVLGDARHRSEAGGITNLAG